eukprot:GHVT01045380.1.p1 GENE.GHVT01045380.1~~GHVT01045380.1.p1  ORF type:complete len:121 (+),score=11.85 GHVT01045380.1:809-1171(+)
MVTTVYPLLNVVVALTPRYQDALRYALALGLEVKFPPKIPPNTLKVMRVLTAIHLRQPNALEEATKAFFEAAWLRGLDVEDDEVLIQTLVSHGIASGHDAREFVHATSGGDIIPIRVAGF